jgi:hypothetical protein
MPKISVEEFSNRLAALCLSGGGRGFPKKDNDKHILYKSIFLSLEPTRDYTEKELNAALEKWLSSIGTALEIDHTSLRRQMVDEGFLSRDKAGTVYLINYDRTADLFDPAIDSLDPAAVIEEARRIKEQKRREFMNLKTGNG